MTQRRESLIFTRTKTAFVFVRRGDDDERVDDRIHEVGEEASRSSTRGCNGFDRDHAAGEAIRKRVR